MTDRRTLIDAEIAVNGSETVTLETRSARCPGKLLAP